MSQDITYTIKKGDTLSTIAAHFGLSSWKEIWNYPANAAFKASHPNPNMIHPGEIVIIPGTATVKPPVNSGSSTTIQMKLVKPESATFTSDHKKFVVNDSDWAKTGTEIKEPEWDMAHSDPIVVTCGTKISCSVKFGVNGPSSLEFDGDVSGNGGTRWLTFEKKSRFKPKQTTVVFESQDVLPDHVFKEEKVKIAWKLKTTSGEMDMGITGDHKIYAILGNPINEGLPEDGLTTRRMETAVSWVGPVQETDAVDLVETLFTRFPVYTLSFDHLPQNLQVELNNDPVKKQALLQAGFAAYMKDSAGGAWPLAQYERYGGECQAIVRLIRGILHQIGCPGKIELKYVNARISGIYDVSTIVKDVGSQNVGPDATKGYALVDGPVQVGHLYTNQQIGFNNYEAYMKYTHKENGVNTASWFGGGVGKFGSVNDDDPVLKAAFETTLINVFWAVIEYEVVLQGAVRKRKVTWLKRF